MALIDAPQEEVITVDRRKRERKHVVVFARETHALRADEGAKLWNCCQPRMLSGDSRGLGRGAGRRRVRTVRLRQMLSVRFERGRRGEYGEQEAGDTCRVDDVLPMLCEAAAKCVT